MVGSLMYAAFATRPDIAYTVAILSKYNQKPLAMHVTAAKKAIRYLRDPMDLCLHYPGPSLTHIGMPQN